MPISSKQIQKIRYNWYAFHYNMRQMGKALDKETIKKCQTACQILPRINLRIMGGIAIPSKESFRFANQIGVDVDLLNEWYLTEAGWQNFQTLWKSLPEPIDLSTGACVQVGELSTFVHSKDDKKLQKARKRKLSTIS